MWLAGGRAGMQIGVSLIVHLLLRGRRKERKLFVDGNFLRYSLSAFFFEAKLNSQSS
jgi:hypothetical protein